MVTVAGTVNWAVLELARVTVKGLVVGPFRETVPRIAGLAAFSAIELTVEVRVSVSGTMVARRVDRGVVGRVELEERCCRRWSMMTNWSEPLETGPVTGMVT